jgi:hypothetical protein
MLFVVDIRTLRCFWMKSEIDLAVLAIISLHTSDYARFGDGMNLITFSAFYHKKASY